jgi:hypothetical protein
MTIRCRVLAFLLVLAGCGGSGSTGGGTPTTCNPLAFAMLNAAGSNAKVCAATVSCIDARCADVAVECAGPDYQTMTYAGTCSSYLACVKGCGCAKSCVDQCDPGTLDCASCLTTKLGMGCTMKCTSEVMSCGS